MTNSLSVVVEAAGSVFGVSEDGRGRHTGSMPWCDTCDEYRAPTALSADKTCVTCDNEVDMADVKAAVGAKPPWHFWLMVIALAAYLGWRAIEAVIWAVGAV